jgi:threonine dehydratase
VTSPTFADVEDAARQIAGLAVETPLLRADALDEAAGARVWVKAECLQRTGSFKFRGAANRITRLSPAERRAGVVAYSSGNHAQAVAAAARIVDCPAAIVMPADTPRLKVEATRGHGAQVVLYDRYRESREGIAAELAAERGAVLVPPFEDPFVIAGQGTAGREAALALQARGEAADLAYVCCSGGGLTAGTVLSLEALSPATKVWSAEPAGFDDTARSLAAGERVANAPEARSICDALQTPEPGALTWSINGGRLAGGAVVTDDEALAAMAFAFRHLKIVLEPGGAVALAAVLQRRPEAQGRTVLVVASGGNVDAAMFARALERTGTQAELAATSG